MTWQQSNSNNVKQGSKTHEHRHSKMTNTNSSCASSTAASRLSAYKNREEERERADRDCAAALVPFLASRSYHLPGNSWKEDLIQYFANSHIVLGLCFHHKLHPVGTWKRVAVLIGSLACGLIISNVLFLYFLNSDQGVSEVLSVDFRVNATVASQSVGISHVAFSNYQIALWTLGTFVHTMFDLSVWYIAACGCCQVGGTFEAWGPHFRWVANYLTLLVVTLTAATATLVVVLRATLEDHKRNVVAHNATQSAGLFDDEVQFGQTSSPDAYRFLISWCIEVLISWFAFYFIFGTIFFSGILGCFKLPLLGGRPREVMLLQQKEGASSSPRSMGDRDEENVLR